MPTLSLLVGTYTTNTDSSGIYRLRITDGEAAVPELILPAQDPSYLLADRDHLYWVNEALNSEAGELGYAQLSSGKAEKLGTLPSMGKHPCHVGVSPEGGWLAVANYTSGDVSIYALAGDGTPVWNSVFAGRRTGPNPARQERPHAHFVSFFRENELVCCDLGGDCLRRILWDGNAWKEAAPFAVLPPGCGPRHLIRAGSCVYVLCELGNELLTLSDADGTLLDCTPLLPAPVSGSAAAIRLSPDGRLLASHRGGDSISVFSLGESGIPVRTDVISSIGRDPRDFLPVKGGLVCACQTSNVVTIFRETEQGYVLTSKAALPCPVCLMEE